MSNVNRKAVSIRVNHEQQVALRGLCEFWNADERTVLKMAFEQFVVATNQLQNKLKKEKEDADNKNNSSVADNSSSAVADDATTGGSPASTDATSSAG